MESQDFDAVVREAVESLPETFRTRLENVLITVQDEPTPELLEEFGEGELFGVYLGVPLIERHHAESGLLPDQIILFQKALQSACHSTEELQDEIRVTVVHELGHFFGLDEDEIEESLEAPRRARLGREEPA